MPKLNHQDIIAISGAMKPLPTDYKDYGGEVVRWADGDNYPDCSVGCKWFAKLAGSLGNDWGVCSKPGAPRAGLLTFEHQAGYVCFEAPTRAKPMHGPAVLR